LLLLFKKISAVKLEFSGKSFTTADTVAVKNSSSIVFPNGFSSPKSFFAVDSLITAEFKSLKGNWDKLATTLTEKISKKLLVVIIICCT